MKYFLFKDTLIKRDSKGVYFLLYSKRKFGSKVGAWSIINEKWIDESLYTPIPEEEAERLEALIRL